MTVRDFIRKERTLASEHGLPTATKQAAIEFGSWVYSKTLRHWNHRPDLIWQYDWDVCVVLDACRYDIFQEVSSDVDWFRWSGDFLYSVGSSSPEWHGHTFKPIALATVSDENIGVVTANPFSAKPAARAAGAPRGSLPLSRHEFTVLDEVWRDEWGVELNGEYLDVAGPNAVARRAYNAWKEYDLDRLIVHFMQPHIPFRSHPEWFGEHENLKHFGEPSKEGGKDPWHRVRDGEIDRAEFVAAYRDNLRWVLPAVKKLYQSTGAKMLVTSDHGNGMGERGVWSHPPEMYISALRRVPALTLPAKRPTPALSAVEPPEDNAAGTQTERLRALGYR